METTDETTIVKRARGRITSATYGPEDHGVLTCAIGVDSTDGHQAFGCLALDERTGASFVAEVCAAFGVAALEDLVGRPCEVGWAFDELHAPIEEMRDPERGAFALNEWRARMWPGTPSVLAQRRAALARDVASRERQLLDARERLAAFEREHDDERAKAGAK